MEGNVPLESKDENGQTTMPLQEIYIQRPEFADYSKVKFSARLSSLRKTVKAGNTQAADDQLALENYKANHESSGFSDKGYIQWQGSEAQELVREDMDAGLHEELEKKELWGSRPQYYENFPLAVFRDKIYQEQQTAKYLHTCQVRGKLHKSS